MCAKTLGQQHLTVDDLKTNGTQKPVSLAYDRELGTGVRLATGCCLLGDEVLYPRAGTGDDDPNHIYQTHGIYHKKHDIAQSLPLAVTIFPVVTSHKQSISPFLGAPWISSAFVFSHQWSVQRRSHSPCQLYLALAENDRCIPFSGDPPCFREFIGTVVELSRADRL